ncbi:MAG: hypothetical protein PHE42_04965 [Candidatus Methanomethylophilaceae archaeon]|nr:hypothetical protein [Candidatus Methanomethylophilaceae archaeon]
MKTKLLASTLLIMGAVAMGGCASSFETPLSSIANEKIASQSLSTLSLLNTPQGSAALERALLSEQAVNLTEQEIDDIKSILGQVDTILTNQTGVNTLVIDSPQEAYEYGLLVTYIDIFANTSSYSLFYNQVKTVDHDLEETEDEVDDLEPEESYGGSGNGQQNGDIKSMTWLEGILVSEEATYNFTSLIKEEIEEDEYETKVHFKLFNDTGFYVKAMQETEIEEDGVESRIRYTVFDGETVITSYCLKVEEEIDENAEIKLRLDDKVYFIEQIFAEGKEYLDVKYSDGVTEARILFEKVISIDEETQEEVIDFIIVE